ncbi:MULTISPECIES: hypothetical protein [Pseudomonas]|nr:MULTISPECIES: hypothetical protein [Pseudomonas]WLG49722.1 hypothetical protein PSH64_23835 [Pseudomonas sp. FP1742]
MTIQFLGQKTGVKTMARFIETLLGNLCGSGLARESDLIFTHDVD